MRLRHILIRKKGSQMILKAVLHEADQLWEQNTLNLNCYIYCIVVKITNQIDFSE